jgi:gentisate 1,2-dioxygenase
MGDISKIAEREMEQYLTGLPAKNLEPLWNRMNAMVPPSPNPATKPHMWKYSTVLPDLETAAKLVPEEQAERRVLMLTNPSMRRYSTIIPAL